ncbi:MAG TPA: RNA 2',3'-cyclic phosphodiesterase [Firmicutes bacterium]|nr:RNA 2',3'-cyclic phosphodiesterase [Bacillota bacterium]
MRLFIAINLLEHQKQELHRLQQRLQVHLQGVKWVSPVGMHITLKFLGEVNPKLLPKIAAAIGRVAASAFSFDFRLRGLGVFPNPSRAKVIWTGMLEGCPQTEALFSRLERELAPLSFLKESRKYIPHLTLGRVRYPVPRDNLVRVLNQEKEFATASGKIDKIVLYQSCLSRQGAKYKPLIEKYLLENKGK